MKKRRGQFRVSVSSPALRRILTGLRIIGEGEAFEFRQGFNGNRIGVSWVLKKGSCLGCRKELSFANGLEGEDFAWQREDLFLGLEQLTIGSGAGEEKKTRVLEAMEEGEVSLRTWMLLRSRSKAEREGEGEREFEGG